MAEWLEFDDVSVCHHPLASLQVIPWEDGRALLHVRTRDGHTMGDFKSPEAARGWARRLLKLLDQAYWMCEELDV